MMLRSRIDKVQTPIIPVIGELIRQTPGTISLGQGVVFYPPPDTTITAIKDFAQNPENHKYKAVEGIPPLLDILQHKLVAENNITVGMDKAIVVTAGSNMAFMNAILAITEKGDEIILVRPYYFNHEMAIVMADCYPKIVDSDEVYQLDITAISEAITDKTKAVVTISPNNPTGVVYPEVSLRQVNQLCKERGIYHIHDEAYEYFTYNNTLHFSPGSIGDGAHHTISLFSLSKTYGFASWRIGYMIIPQHLLLPIKKIQDTILICPPVISQYAAIGALQAGKGYCLQHLIAINQVREILVHRLASMGNICSVAPADGAFYFFLKVHTQLKDMEVVSRLIKEYQVAVIPGTTFGMSDGCYLRVAYGALGVETASEGIDRLVRGLQGLGLKPRR